MKKKNTLNYLYQNKALNALMLFGFFGSISFLQGQEIADQSLIVEQNVVTTDSLFNPFTFESLHLPFIRPSHNAFLLRLESEEAQTAINQVFEEEGVNLEKNYYYKKDNITVVLNGFSPDSNIGYIWVDWDNIGDGMAWRPPDTPPAGYEEILAQNFLSYDINQLSNLEYELENVINSKKQLEKFIDRFNIAQNIAPDEERLLAYKEIYLDCLIDNRTQSDNQVNTEFFQNITPQSTFKEKENAFIRLMLIPGIKRSLKNFEKKAILMEIFDAILLEDKQERAKQYDNFIVFLRAHRSNKWKSEEKRNLRTQQILNLQNNEKIAQEIQVFANDHLDKKLSLREAKYLANIHYQEGDFIAPIRIRNYYKGSKAKALKRLENHVRQYIQWAKQQSGH